MKDLFWDFIAPIITMGIVTGMVFAMPYYMNSIIK